MTNVIFYTLDGVWWPNFCGWYHKLTQYVSFQWKFFNQISMKTLFYCCREKWIFWFNNFIVILQKRFIIKNSRTKNVANSICNKKRKWSKNFWYSHFIHIFYHFAQTIRMQQCIKMLNFFRTNDHFYDHLMSVKFITWTQANMNWYDLT